MRVGARRHPRSAAAGEDDGLLLEVHVVALVVPEGKALVEVVVAGVELGGEVVPLGVEAGARGVQEPGEPGRTSPRARQGRCRRRRPRAPRPRAHRRASVALREDREQRLDGLSGAKARSMRDSSPTMSSTSMPATMGAPASRETSTRTRPHSPAARCSRKSAPRSARISDLCLTFSAASIADNVVRRTYPGPKSIGAGLATLVTRLARAGKRFARS